MQPFRFLESVRTRIGARLNLGIGKRMVRGGASQEEEDAE